MPSIASSGYQASSVPGSYFRSRRVKKETIEKPWAEKKEPRQKWLTIFPLLGFIVGVIIIGILIWTGLRSVDNHKYCLVLKENFTSWNNQVWTKEVEVGGFGCVTPCIQITY